MTIYFNTEWDGGAWSDRPAAFGKIKTGPLGMLSILETRCGTSGMHASPAARVAAMMAAITTRSDSDDWYRSSFANDPWATAAELLSCRDELLTARIAAGPSAPPTADDPLPRPRLQALTTLADDPDIPGDGIPDRITDVLHELRSAEFYTLQPLADYRIVVEQPEELVPPVWGTVFTAVTAAGGVVEYRDSSLPTGSVPAAPAAPSPYLTLLTASDEWQAAEHVAAFLAQLEDQDPVAARRCALVVAGDATVLDWTLQRWDLPVTGRSGVSAARWGVQILPAFLATLWSPADPQAIASFLSLAASVVPAVVSRALIHALSEHPGTGGPQWTEACEQIAAATDTGTAAFYNRLFAAELFDPERGVPPAVLDERVAWLAGRLGTAMDERPVLRKAVGHIEELREIIGRLSTETPHPIPRTLLEDIVDTVVHPVAAGPEEQTAPWTVHATPATVSASVSTVLIWNGTHAEPATAQRFTTTEREILYQAGYRVESPETVRSRREWNRRWILSEPNREIVAVVPMQITGRDTELAPWLAELKQTLEQPAREIDLSDTQSTITIGDIPVARRAADEEASENPPAVLEVPPGAISYPGSLSYSAIHSLIGCPLQWTLGRIGELSAASNVTLPTGNQMMGTLTHKIIERIAREYATEGTLPEDSGAIAATLFDDLVPQMAAELVQPGRNLARRRYKEIVVATVTALQEVIHRLGLTVRQVETFMESPWELALHADGSTTTVAFRGPADMELADDAGSPFVLDLKYSYAETFYTELVSTGSALQLASYAWLIERHTGRKTIGSGYFLLPRRTLITDSPRAGDDAVVSERTLEEIWRRGERSTIEALSRLHIEGVVEITGLQEAEDDQAAGRRRQRMEESGGLYVKPPCKFCDYGVICGYRRGNR
ncbi:MAG TPA: PD-(D/E)XK nuclease family protein [Alkalispirochaeta sp.]|nr:PD-(D/E)XK nuclease family protein [Alkalispirochaeta sp.]